jgi:probable addiction module antidote protein
MPIRSVAKTLASEEHIAVYWEEVVTRLSNAPSLMAVAIDEIAHARAINRIAQESGIDRSVLWEAINGDGAITAEQLKKAAHSLGLASGIGAG